MADKKEKTSGGGSSINPQGVMGIVIVIMLLLTVVNNGLKSDNWVGRLFGGGSAEYSEGDSIINKQDVRVRQSVGGTIIGTQAKLLTGKIVQGPIEQFDKMWWRVNYEEAPDGWVEGSLISNKVGMQRLFNIFPLTFGFMRPTFIVLCFIGFILLFIVVLKTKALHHMIEKKKAQVEEQKLLKQGNMPKPDIRPVDETVPDLPVPNLPVGESPKTEDVHNKRWANIQGLIRSYNANDWKQAVIEADIILDEMLERMGYKGKSIGEKLKTVQPSDFMTLNQAWEAHKFRNRVAHGSSYVLTRDEAERVIKMYEEVFNEFFYV